MKRIQTLVTRDLAKSQAEGGCGECQTSCQSACKTSCGIANQPCEQADKPCGSCRRRAVDRSFAAVFCSNAGFDQ